MHHEPTLEVTARAIPRIEAGVMAGLIAWGVHGEALRVDNQGPLADIYLAEG